MDSPDSESSAPLLQRPAAPVTEGKSPKNCLFGCLIGVVVMVVGVFLFLHFAKKYIIGQIVEYTDEQPVEFEKPKADGATVAELIGKFRRFGLAMEKGEETDPLVLSDYEINVLLNHHPEFKEIAGKLEVEIDGDVFIGRISVGLDEMDNEDKLPEGLRGRYLNGEATFEMSLKDGKAELYIVKLKASGKEVPDVLMDKIRGQNLMEEKPGKKPNPGLQNLEEIKVEDGKIYFVPKKASAR